MCACVCVSLLTPFFVPVRLVVLPPSPVSQKVFAMMVDHIEHIVYLNNNIHISIRVKACISKRASAAGCMVMENPELLLPEIEALYQQIKIKEKKLKRQEIRLSQSQAPSPLKPRDVNSDHRRGKNDSMARVVIPQDTPKVTLPSRGHIFIQENQSQTQEQAVAPQARKLQRTVQMKVLVVGDTKCGKTSTIQRFVYVSRYN